ncbi:heat shock 70 family protein [Natronosalvus halobius]|uniref:heat shock 70 family protein n=1 Tax=Natronosalvus halobius TaxID=2953746 RepID=UPI00209E96FA|nr:heat shock 70 family protein [Natronosalvus halobius]USZ71001.1 heat shock 70 family protein [Natronosalvus halobius]
MNRRRYLETIAAGLAVGGLAGCLDDLQATSRSDADRTAGNGDGAEDDGTGSTDGTDDSTTGGSAGRDEADREIRMAAGRLNRAGASLRESRNSLEDPESADYDPEEPQAFLDEALESLEAAEDAGPTEAQRADIEELNAYAAVLGPAIEVTAVVTDDGLEEEVDRVNDAIVDENLVTARSVAESLVDTFAPAQETLEPALEGVESLDADRLADLAITDLAAVQDGVRTLESVVDSLVVLSESLVSLVAGHEALEEGGTLADEEAFDAACTAFDDAATIYADTAALLEDGYADAPEGLVAYFETALCQSDHLERAAVAFNEAAKAADDGDRRTAEEREADAEEQLELAEACGA